MSRIILASASPRRRELLTQIGMEFQVIPSNIEEKTEKKSPGEMVQELSEKKAMDIFLHLPKEERADAIVIGADTVVALEGRVMGKPGSEKEAVEMLSCLQGRIHQVYTGVTLAGFGRQDGSFEKVSFYEETSVALYPMSGEEIRDYVAGGEPMDKAGAYAIQGGGAVFIREIHGSYSNVVGLPVDRVYQEVKAMEEKGNRQ